jgi:hypothetical protein
MKPTAVILTVIPSRPTAQTGQYQADGIVDLACKHGTERYLMDGREATHNRSVAGSRPVSPTPTPQVTGLRHLLCLPAGVLLLESYGAMVTAARAGGRAIPELWPLGTEALAQAMEVSVLEAKRLHHRAVLRLSWLLLVASVALSTLLQVAVAPPSLVGYLTAGATPVWLLGSFAVLSLLYRAEVSADPATTSVEIGAERSPASAGLQDASAEVLTKRAQAGLPP